MSIRSKILIYFSVLSIALVGIAFVLIYTLFSNYRREEFQQRIKDKTITTVKFLVEIEQIDHNLLQKMDEYTINNLYKEKVIIFNSDKSVEYTSIDDTKIKYQDDILKKLNPKNNLIETVEDDFDVVGICFRFNEKNYYGIAKAYDEFGLSKLFYLKSIFIIIFIVISTVILITSYLLSRQISRPINQMASELKKVNLDSKNNLISVPGGKDEIHLLANRFNELMNRLNDAFAFQKHAIHHISHELKTPIAILVSNFEKMEHEQDHEKLRQMILVQKEDTKNLGDIINALLEISKVETGTKIETERLRIDEIIFDAIEEMKILEDNFQFNVEIDPGISNEDLLCIEGSQKLIRICIMNILANCMRYSNNHQASIVIKSLSSELTIDFINSGPLIGEHEKQYIFQHFFRGENSKNKRGFGLGLVLINKILELHHGSIYYSSENELNTFCIKLPQYTQH